METRYVGRFEVLGDATIGGAAALAAVDPGTGAAVALREVSAVDPAAADRWSAYVGRLSALDHPGIARVRELLLAEGRAYLVQDRVDGPSLADLLRVHRATEAQAAGVATVVLDALATAHAAGVVTGALDPAGVVIDANGRPVLVDVGLAGAFGAVPAQAYTPPERLTGQAASPASDVYSAAALTVHLLRGTPALPPGTTGLDEGMAAVLGPALAVDPAARPTAAAVAAALADAAARSGGTGWRAAATLAGVAGVGGAAGGALAAGATGAAAAATPGAAAAATPGAAASAATPGAASAVAPGAASAPGSGYGAASAVPHAVPHAAGPGASSAAGHPGASSAQAVHGAQGATHGASSASAAHGASSATATHGAGHGVAATGKGLGLGAKAALAAGAVAVGGGVVAAAVLLTGGQTEHVSVPATADVYLAGTDEVDLADPGTEPVAVGVDGASTVSFSEVKGQVGACNGCDPEGVDGGQLNYGSTALTAVNGIAGVTHADRTLFLVGVFVGKDAPHSTDVVDLSGANDEARQHPGLGEPFFVGDGLDADGDRQEVTVPDGATRLYLGFADGNSFAGQPGAYGDNSGTVSLDVEVD